MKRPFISVVICTYNPNVIHLERAIGSVLAQDLEQSMYEFFIIDNNSAQPVREIECVRRNRIRVVAESVPGLTAARERAARTAKAELLVFVDTDNVLASDYLSTVLDLFQNRHLGVLSGQIEPEYEVEPPGWFRRFEPALAIRRFPNDDLYLTTLPLFNEFFPVGTGYAIRTSILLDYFRSTKKGERIEGRRADSLMAGEDIDIDLHAISQGYIIGVTRKLRVQHIIPRQRLSERYVKRLAIGNLKSIKAVNDKWHSRFGRNVLDLFDKGTIELLIKVILCCFLSFLAEFRILLHIHVFLFFNSISQRRNSK